MQKIVGSTPTGATMKSAELKAWILEYERTISTMAANAMVPTDVQMWTQEQLKFNAPTAKAIRSCGMRIALLESVLECGIGQRV